MSIELVMASNHLILLPSSPLALILSQHQEIFSSKSALCSRWPKYWSFSFSISLSNEYLGLISFRMDWFDLLAVQGTLKSLLQHHSSKASVLYGNLQTKIMASGPITSWQIDGKMVKTMADFIFLGSKITADGDCSHEIKRRLHLGRKVMTNLGSILKSRDITLPTKVHLVKAMVFPVVVYGCESWTIKKAECWRIDAFELLRVLWTARRSNQSILKEISPGCSLEGLMLKLKLPILRPPDAKSWLIWKDPDAGKDWGQEEKGMRQDEMVGWHYRLDGPEFG